MTLLKLSALEANYGAVRALQGISMNVEEGAVVALLGANGAGKSTTLKAISGMVQPSAGGIEFAGESPVGKTPNQIVSMGIAHVPEGRRIFKDLTVSENLRMGAYSRSDKQGIAQDLDMVLELFPRLSERSRQLGGSLSGGEQQMLAIGRGIMARPKLLLLDEPSLGLAPLVVKQMFETIQQINGLGTTVLLAEQNAFAALKIAHRAYVMENGRLVMEGDREAMLGNEEVRKAYIGA